MIDKRYERLERIRDDIKKDKEKVSRLLEQIKQKELKLKEAEASQIVADVGALKLSPEQLGSFLELIQSGKLNEVLSVDNKTNPGNKGFTKADDEILDDLENMDDEN